MTLLAPGTVKVISRAATPPRAQASAIRSACSGFSARMTATKPEAAILSSVCVLPRNDIFSGNSSKPRPEHLQSRWTESSRKKRFSTSRVTARHFFVQSHPQARPFGHLDKAAVNQWFREALDQIIPERNLGGVKLKRKKVWDRGAEVNRGQSADRTADVVRSHRHRMHIGELRNALGDRQTSAFLKTGSNERE